FDPRIVLATYGGLIFLWLNAALIRALHYTAGTPLTLYGIAHSTLVQASLSIFWSILGFAAMTFAARSKRRLAWIVGASLMGVVVVKQLLVALPTTGPLARLASVLPVGVLLLITGCLAPPPPRQADAGDPHEA